MAGVLGHRRHYPTRHLRRVTPTRLMRGERGLLVWQNLLACTAVAIVCAVSIAMIWIALNAAIRQQATAQRMRAERVVAGQVNILTEAARQELNTIDQSLTILQAAWNADPAGFDLKSWQSRMPALTDVADDIFIANDKRLIVQDILPQAVGQGIGAAYVNFSRGSLESTIAESRAGHDSGLVLGEQADNGIVRQYLMYVIRALRARPGWLIGASYRSAALVKVFAEGSLGERGVAALIDLRRGGVQAVAGPAALHPTLDVSDTPMYRAIQQTTANAGTWSGPTAMDGVDRIHAFRRIPGRDLLILAGVDQADWMAPATAWAESARWLALIGSAVIAAAGGVIIWVLWRWDANRRRRRALEQAAFQLDSAQSGLYAARLAAQTSMAQVQAVMDGSSDGIAVFDADWYLVAWNPPFAATSGLSPEILNRGLPMDELLRHQARAGAFGLVIDIEGEIARRMAEMHTDAELVAFSQAGPDGRPMTVRGCGTPDGGVMLIAIGASSERQPRLAPPEEHAEAEAAEEGPVEW